MHKSKICIRCGEEKPLDEFYVHKRMADGHLNVCKSCVKLRIGRYRKVKRALKSGKIVRPEYCEVCGKKCRTEAHHKNYDESLRVVWMCRTCHANYHTGKSEQAELTRKIVDSIFEKMIS